MTTETTTDTPRPLLEHLEELRQRLFRVFGCIGIAALVTWIWVEPAYNLLMKPGLDALGEDRPLKALTPPEIFFVQVKTALLVGFMISLPVTLYQGWAFVAPGLYKSEKRLAGPFVIATTVLFLAGDIFGHQLAFPFIFDYFMSLETETMVNEWTTQGLFAFQSRLYLAFGIAFQLPIAMLFLAGARIVSVETMARGRRYAIVSMFIVGAILTPPDVVSQIMLAGPMIALYEIGLLAARLIIRRRTTATRTAAVGDG